MSTLRNVLSFVGVDPGNTATLAHGLNVNGVGKLPDEVKFNALDFAVVSADETDITIRNDGSGTASVDVLVEYWYSPTRAMSPDPLSVAPFVVSGGSTGGSCCLPDPLDEDINFTEGNKSVNIAKSTGVNTVGGSLTLQAGLGGDPAGAAGYLRFYIGTTEFVKIGNGVIQIRSSGSLKTVTVGANDSGGAGYQLLRVPN